MKRRIAFRPLVADDLAEIHDWYELRRPGLSAEFDRELEEACDTIQEFPLASRVLYRGVRRRHMGRFPYYVYYVVGEQTIIVVAIVHERRSPEVWMERT
jgi:plasmid stabilization system protein ParE